MNDQERSRLRLIGAVRIGAEVDVGAWFSRLMNEVPNTGEIVRVVRYEGTVEGQPLVHFLGVEVDKITDVPEGMMALDLREKSWTVLRSGDGHSGALTWDWIESRATGHLIGEFSALCPPDWTSNASTSFAITANAYFAKGRGPQDDVCLVEYNPDWPRQYEEIARRLAQDLGSDIALRIEHYGSTAIPGMPAKSVIDILMEIPSFAEARRRVVPVLDALENEYWHYRDHLCFILRESFMGKRTCHVHMAPAGHRIWEGIAFRDYLRDHLEDAARYAALKHQLADSHQTDREAYTDAKAAFVKEVTGKALRSRSNRV